MRFARLSLLSVVLSLAMVMNAGLAEPTSIAACAVALTPLVQITNLTDHQKYAWLDLITSETYDAAKTAIKASGDIDLMDLIKVGDAEASYDTFSEKRRTYLEKHQGNYSHDLALSTFTQTLPSDAHAKWLKCVEVVSHNPGLHAWFDQESASSARLVMHFYGTPNTSITASVTVLGATPSQSSYTLAHDGDKGVLLTRKGTSNIIVNINGGELTTGAASAFPGNPNAPGLFVSPYVVTPQTAKPVPNQSCSFEVSNFTAVVEVPVAVTPNAAALLLDATSGGSVAPGPGPLDFQLERSLDDVTLKGPSELKVKVGDLTATIATVAAGDANCAHAVLRLPGSKVQVHYAMPVYQWVMADATTTQVELDFYAMGGGDYQFWGGDIGCPPRGVGCGNLYRAQFVLRDANNNLARVASFDQISRVSIQSTGHWYSCMDGVCGTNGDFTETSDQHSAKCFGKQTCWVWRHEDDGHDAKETFSVTYRPLVKKCVRNCPTSATVVSSR